MLQNAYFLAKIGADTAENEQHFAEILIRPSAAQASTAVGMTARWGRAFGRRSRWLHAALLTAKLVYSSLSSCVSCEDAFFAAKMHFSRENLPMLVRPSFD